MGKNSNIEHIRNYFKKFVCAGSNPPSVFTILRFAAYLNLVQDPIVLFCFAPCGSSFSFLRWKSQVLPSLCAMLDYFLFRCQSSLIIHLQITFPVWREEFPLPYQCIVL